MIAARVEFNVLVGTVVGTEDAGQRGSAFGSRDLFIEPLLLQGRDTEKGQCAAVDHCLGAGIHVQGVPGAAWAGTLAAHPAKCSMQPHAAAR
jgi:hypothetical protein